MDSRIENTTGDADKDHKIYGSEDFKLISKREAGSNSEKIVNQLVQVREEEKKKSNGKN
ncbi:hypothetical protein [Chryseobacterium sp. sg2396]|uniref:hypothetical protein n=1 Tax=Chryseobacterium sp. sg2396 TaxID=3276280 RepID=UPI0036706B96